jgi:hypothetical protein
MYGQEESAYAGQALTQRLKEAIAGKLIGFAWPLLNKSVA